MSQPNPIPNGSRSIHDLVIADLSRSDGNPSTRRSMRVGLEQRKRRGLETYGTVLQTYNGRDATLDLWEELLDAVCYAYQAWAEDPTNSELRIIYDATFLLCLRVAEVRA